MAARKAQNKEGVSLTGAASRGYRSRWLVLGMVRRHPSFCVTILIDPKNPLWPLFSQNPTKYHDMTPFRCARDDDGDGTMSTQVPARKASAKVKGCLHRLLQLEHNPGVHGGRDSDVDGTHADEGPGNTRTKNAPCFLYLGICLYAYVAGTVR